ncbi:MAG TPA: NAD-dependent epimerase/dehydratase family protein [Solimonas sp.]|nr:NAD-dependent epimerase/dehydratase family protein [Solimonas sp.]
MDSLEERLPRQALIVGCGDIGQRVATRLQAMGREVTAIVRSAPSAAALREQGLAVVEADLDHEAPSLPTPLLFWFAPPPAEGEGDPRLRRWLAAQASAPPRLVYISTSGVYGDCGGRWIDEDEPLRPLSARALRRIDAEDALREYAASHRSEVVILRVPGIYGPGRLPRQRLQQGLPVVREAESPYTNRIHAEDLAQAALHAAAWGGAGRAYNVADGNPTTMCDYFTRCAALLGLPPPPQLTMAEAQQQLTPAMWSFMEESKRLQTARLHEELRFTPRYPDLASGLPAAL